jgi:hypothetical protein
LVIAAAIGICVTSGVVRAQEKTPQARLSGAWQLNAELSTPIAEPGVQAEGKTNKIGGGGGRGSQSTADSNPLQTPSVKSLNRLIADLCEAPLHMAVTAGDVINLIDDHGVARRFSPINKAEKIDYDTGKPSFRTHWDGAMLVQDINGDSIEMTRTFETTPDGSRLTVTLTIRRQPDPEAMAAAGNRGDVRKYIYDRVG